jgi:hypothetical protein
MRGLHKSRLAFVASSWLWLENTVVDQDERKEEPLSVARILICMALDNVRKVSTT